jgi:hypothetical protein
VKRFSKKIKRERESSKKTLSLFKSKNEKSKLKKNKSREKGFS